MFMLILLIFAIVLIWATIKVINRSCDLIASAIKLAAALLLLVWLQIEKRLPETDPNFGS